MTHPDMFIDYKGQIKKLKKELKKNKHKAKVLMLFKIKCLIKKLREKGKHGLALKIVNKYNLKQVSESYYD